jgi:hypothetical protein
VRVYGNWFPIIQPDYAPLDSILATANARKVHADYEASIKQHKEQNSLDNYKYELYLKKAHENDIRMEIFKLGSIDVYV